MPSQTILLIDFDPHSIEGALRCLTEAGYGVEVANDGLAGMEAFKRIQPDLVLIEPMVPKKHGFEVCRDIKGSRAGRNTPVLITTGFYRGKKHHAQAKRLYGCDDYLEKPVSGEDLLATCRRFLEKGSEPTVAGTTEERIPALDDLTEEEIIAHLDALIVEQPAPSQPPEPAGTIDAAEFFPDIVKVQPAPRAKPEPAPSLDVATGRSRLVRWALPAFVLMIAVGTGLYFLFDFDSAGEGAATEPRPAVARPEEPQVAAEVDVAEAEPIPVVVQHEEPQVAAEEAAVVETPQPVRAAVARRAEVSMEPYITIDTAPLPERDGVALSVGALPEPGEPLAEPEPPAFLRGDLIDLAEADSPPVSIQKPMPGYHPMARQMRQQGTVILRLLIDEQGHVEQVETVSNGAGRLLGETALEKAKSWIYRPAMKDGVEVKVWKLEQVVFTLDASE